MTTAGLQGRSGTISPGSPAGLPVIGSREHPAQHGPEPSASQHGTPAGENASIRLTWVALQSPAMVSGATPNWAFRGGHWPARDGDRLLRAGDGRDRRRHARPCAGPYCAGWVSARTGRAEDPVLRHVRGPRRLFHVGRWPRRCCVIPGWSTDLRGQRELSSFGSVIEELAGRITVIRYDKPGCGPPDRDRDDVSFDGQVASALAVADAAGAGHLRLSGAFQGGPAAAPLSGSVVRPTYPPGTAALAGGNGGIAGSSPDSRPGPDGSSVKICPGHSVTRPGLRQAKKTDRKQAT